MEKIPWGFILRTLAHIIYTSYNPVLAPCTILDPLFQQAIPKIAEPLTNAFNAHP